MEEDKKTIIKYAEDFDFYPFYVKEALEKWKYSLAWWGFMIYGGDYYAESMINIEFIFVLPEYRRKGIFTKIIKHYKSIADIISFTTSEKSMVHFASKEGFYNLGVCRSGNEIFYVWSDKYDKDDLIVLK